MGTGFQREVVVALPCAPHEVPVATHLRGALIVTSFHLMREQGHESRYFELLPRRLHETIRSLSATGWVPMDYAVAHYEVMGQLFPRAEQQIANGRLTAERAQNAYISTLARGMRSAGALTFTSGLKRMPGVLARQIDGGGAVAISTVGAKDVRIEMYGYPILDVAYVRHGWQGMFESSLSVLSRRVFVRLDPNQRGKGCADYGVAWV